MSQDLTQWEYTEMDIKNIQDLQKAGLQGWEYVGDRGTQTAPMYSTGKIFKRPLQKSDNTPHQRSYQTPYQGY